MATRQGLDWERDGANWPLRAFSGFIKAPQLRWHVQYAAHPDPQAPNVLLLHGTGASTHSWRDVFPLLRPHCSVLALDFPGHAFSAMPAAHDTARLFSVPGMAAGVAQLLAQMGFVPHTVVGHSAGAAVACMLSLDGHVPGARIISVNGALLPLDGLAGQLFSPMAKLLAKAPWVPELFSWQAAQPAVLQRLLDGTGSQLDATGRALYRQLIANPAHGAGALAMMAHWDLHRFWARLPQLQAPLRLVVGEGDLIVPPSVAQRAAQALQRQPRPAVVGLAGLGHLAHEEQPQRFADLILHSLS
jgi:magnesium chelatase accessory protein